MPGPSAQPLPQPRGVPGLPAPPGRRPLNRAPVPLALPERGHTVFLRQGAGRAVGDAMSRRAAAGGCPPARQPPLCNVSDRLEGFPLRNSQFGRQSVPLPVPGKGERAAGAGVCAVCVVQEVTGWVGGCHTKRDTGSAGGWCSLSGWVDWDGLGEGELLSSNLPNWELASPVSEKSLTFLS